MSTHALPILAKYEHIIDEPILKSEGKEKTKKGYRMCHPAIQAVLYSFPHYNTDYFISFSIS